MRQVWLKSNRRVSGVAAIGGMLLMSCGTMLALSAGGEGSVGATGGTFLGIGTAVLLVSVRCWWRPRLAYQDDCLLVFLTSGRPYRVPIDLVEVFFAGQTASKLPGRRGEDWESRSVVVRLSQAARQWHGQPVAARLGAWFGGYIVIRGIWCESITRRKVEELNRKLIAVHRQRRAQAAISAVAAEERVGP